MAGAVLTDGADEGFLSCVDLEVAVQQSFPHKTLPAARPGAGVTLAVYLDTMLTLLSPHSYHS